MGSKQLAPQCHVLNPCDISGIQMVNQFPRETLDLLNREPGHVRFFTTTTIDSSLRLRPRVPQNMPSLKTSVSP